MKHPHLQVRGRRTGKRVCCPHMIHRSHHFASCVPPRASQSGETIAHGGHRPPPSNTGPAPGPEAVSFCEKTASYISISILA